MGIPVPIIGGSYEGRVSDFNASRCVNQYVVTGTNEEGNKYPAMLQGTPGCTEFCDTGTSTEIRGMIAVGNYLYAVAGNGFYRITTVGATTSLGTLNSATGHCYLEYNSSTGSQIMIVDGTTGYIYNTSTGAFAQITDADFPGASTLAFQDGYFIVSRPNTREWWHSDSYDGTAWTGTSYATKEGAPDNLLRVLCDHRELWLFGAKTTEVWYNAGSGTPPFSRKIDEILQRGISAAASAAAEDNTIFWLDDRRMVQRAVGYKPETISTRQIEYQFSSYDTVSDAIGFCYSQDGHTFYVLAFPTANKTWVYDAATNFWHERASWPSPYTGRWRANCYAEFNDQHLIGDYANGKIYELDLSVYAEDGNVLKTIRRAQAIHKDRLMLFHNRLDIEFETGVGLASGQGSDPVAMVRWSDDGGHTWSNEHQMSIGKMGEYGKRVYRNRLGRSRSRVYEISVTDPVKRNILAAHLDATVGTS